MQKLECHSREQQVTLSYPANPNLNPNLTFQNLIISSPVHSLPIP